MIWIYIVVLIVYFMCPKYLKLLIFAINLFVPDAVPVVDELVMIAGLIGSSD